MQQNIFKNGLFIVLGLAILVGYLILFWACDKGIDLTDESFYIAGYYHHQNSKLFPSSFFLVVDTFFGWLELSLYRVRFVRVLITITASVFIALGVWISLISTPKKNLSDFYKISLLSISGGLVTYSWGPLAISYNTLTFLLLSVIFLTVSLLANKPRLLIVSIIGFFLGIELTLLFFVKQSVFILLLPFYLGMFIMFKKHYNYYQAGGFILSCFVGIGSCLIILFSDVKELTDEILRMNDAYSFKLISGERKVDFFRIYKDNLLKLLNETFVPILLIIPIVLYVRFRKQHQFVTWIIVSVLFVYFAYKHDWWIGGTPGKYQHFEPYFIVFCILLSALDFSKLTRRYSYILISMMLLPVIGSLGSTNGISAQSLFFLPFFLTGIYVLFELNEKRYVYFLITPIVVFIAVSQCVIGIINYPYRDEESLFDKKNELVEKGAFRNQLLGKRNSQLYTQIKEYETNGVPYLFTLRHQTGLALLLNKMPFSFDWLNENYPNRICKVIQLTEKEKLQNIMFILPKDYNNKSEIEKCLKRYGINLKKDFHIDKEIEYFNWDKHKDITLQVFVAK